jgi:4'-phosphopantetheinyl transferase
MNHIGDVLVAYSRIDGSPTSTADAGRLSARERDRVSRFVGRDAELRAALFIEGRRLLRELVSRLAPGVDPEVTALCGNCGADDHGALHPVAAPVVVSLSYSGSLVAVSAAPSSAVAALGIDVEAGKPGEILHDLSGLFAPAEPPTRRRWTAIEAAVKADGRGLVVPPERVEVTATRASVPGAGEPFRLCDAGAPEGFTATLALARRG